MNFSSIRHSILAAVIVAALSACPDGRAETAQALSSPVPLVRAEALRRLPRWVSEEDLPLLLRAAEDPATPVREAATEPLAALETSRAVDTLGQLLGDREPSVRLAAARALGRVDSPKARPYLIAAYGRRGPTLRLALAEAIEEQGGELAELIRAEAAALQERNLAALRANAPAERAGAVEELGRAGRPESFEALVPLLTDRSLVVASAAARALGELGLPDARALLEPLLAAAEDELRGAAAEALGRLGDRRAEAALTKLAQSSATSALAAAKALTLLPVEGAGRCAAALRAQAAPAARLLAAWASEAKASCDTGPLAARLEAGGHDALLAIELSAQLRARALTPLVLARALDEKEEPELRLAALEALGVLGDDATKAALLPLLTQDEAAYRRARADWVAGPLSHTFAPGFAPEGKAKQLTELMKRIDAPSPRPRELVDDLPPSLRARLAALVRTLGSLGASEVKKLADELASDPDPVLRIAGLRARGEGRVELTRKLALTDPDDEVRLAAAQALARSGDRAALAAVLREGDAAQRDELAAHLPTPLDKALREALLAAFTQDPRAALTRALGRSMGTDAVPTLLAGLEDAAVPWRRVIVEELGRLGATSAHEALRRELFHDRPELRAAAATALGRLGVSDAERPLLSALAAHDYAAEVRRAAAQALAAH